MKIARKKRVLMVTGVYLPEVNGAILQCSQLIKKLSNTVDFRVMAGSTQPAASIERTETEIMVARMGCGNAGILCRATYSIAFLLMFLIASRECQIIHIHGFSIRNAIIILIAKLMRKKVILKMTSFGQDDTETVKNRSRLLWEAYKLVDAYVSIGPAFSRSLTLSGIDKKKCHLIPNSVDLKKFHPALIPNRIQIKKQLGFGENETVVLFVGHMSSDKRPELAYEAWRALIEKGHKCLLVVIGRTSHGYEVDADISKRIISDAENRGIRDNLFFVDFTDRISLYMQAADILLHPSVREGSPNVVLEAMASGMPCVVTQLPGVTDALIVNGKSGFLIEMDDLNSFGRAIEFLVNNPATRIRVGKNARRVVGRRHEISFVAAATNKLYSKLVE